MKGRENILVTGGCGYIGSHVVKALSEAGHRVLVIDDLSTGSPQALLNGETLIVGDAGDEKLLSSVLDQEHTAGRDISSVLHFAGSIVVPESVEYPLDYYANNTEASLRLIRSCVIHGVRNFVFSSTASVYGEASTGLLSEDLPTVPTNPYSRSKLMTEWVLEDVSRASNLNYVALRYFNVAGVERSGRLGPRSRTATHLLRVASQVALGERDAIHVYGTDYPTPDGTGVRDYIHVEDLATAHVAALDYLLEGGRSAVLNCGYGKGYSVLQILSALEELVGPIRKQMSPRRPGDVASLIADTSKLHGHLDWQPSEDNLHVIVSSALAWEARLFGRTTVAGRSIDDLKQKYHLSA